MWLFLEVVAVFWILGLESTKPSTLSGAQTLQALHCPSCERIHCTPRQTLKLQCKGGISSGICGCCPTCAKMAGESCGGTWDYLGKCDEGLVCIYQDLPDDKLDTVRTGICQAVLVSKDENCHPECTREYCQTNPSEICSARSALLEKQACSDSCLHTSCLSCLVLMPPICPQSCTPSDSSCLHRFGRCVDNNLSAPLNRMCFQNLQSNSDGYFMCLVPGCPKEVN